MKIGIFTSGRFHVADLARELINNGHEVYFHSIVPWQRLQRFGIPKKNQICYLKSCIAAIAIERLIKRPHQLSSLGSRILEDKLDNIYSEIIPGYDIIIGMSGLCVNSLRVAKQLKKHVILERGSMHILDQQKILKNAKASSNISNRAIRRELEGYNLADTISIPSRHVEISFISRGIESTKLFRNPYGVSTKAFKPNDRCSPKYDVITVGTWCRRKGSDTLARVVLNQLNKSLLHVGTVGDLHLPSHLKFTHFDAVPQHELCNYYNQAKVFAMPSREDGFGMVFSQALACGLPIVGSITSGAADLADITGLKYPYIQIVPSDSDNLLASSLLSALQARKLVGTKWISERQLKSITWQDYGQRYSDFLCSLKRIG